MNCCRIICSKMKEARSAHSLQFVAMWEAGWKASKQLWCCILLIFNVNRYSDWSSAASSVTNIHGLRASHIGSQIPAGPGPARGQEPEQQREGADVAMLDEAEEILRVKQEQEWRQYFFTMALQVLEKERRKPKRQIGMGELYKKCRERKIEVSNWDYFIRAEYGFI